MSGFGTVYLRIRTSLLKVFLTARSLPALLTWSICVVFSPSAWAGLSVPATSATGQVTLTWSGEAASLGWTGVTTHGGTVEIFERSVEGSGEWRRISNRDMETSFTLDLMRLNGTYDYYSKTCIQYSTAAGAGVHCEDSEEYSTVVNIPEISVAPENVQVNKSNFGCTEDSLLISWDEIDHAAYSVEEINRKPGSAWPATWRRIAAGLENNEFSVGGLTPGREYRFRVSAAVLDADYSEWSETPAVSKTSCEVVEPSQTPFQADPQSLVSDYEIDETDQVAATGGKFRVNESGAATYSIPVLTVPGTAGVAPQLSLDYSSQAGNGLLGRGWSLGGLSSISRCRQTLLNDKQALPIQWNEEDRFCLNGQRLILVSGDYGSPNSVYKTEIDTQRKITAKGGSAGKPDYFLVESKDGSKTWYGKSGSDPSEMAGRENGVADSEKVLTWSISRFEDNMGNKIEYEYLSDADGQRLAEVRYAYGSSFSSAGARIKLFYEGRSDPLHSYVGGKKFNTGVRLRRIESYSGIDPIRSYALDYKPESTGTTASKVSVLDRIEECAVDGNCLAPLEFEWHSLASVNVYAERTLASSRSIFSHTFGDIDGDGLTDVLWGEKDGATVRFYYLLAGESESRLFTSLYSSNNDVEGRLIDLNLDGRSDWVYRRGNTWRYRLSQPVSEDGKLQWRLDSGSSSLIPIERKELFFADLNSDGIMDAYYFFENARTINIHKGIRTSYSDSVANPYGFAISATSYSVPNNGDLHLNVHAWGDFNGDGLGDLVVRSWDAGCTDDLVCGDRRLDLMLGQEDGSLAYSQNIYAGGYRPKSVQAVDINGDGISDLAYRIENGVWQYRISDGKYLMDAKPIHDPGYSAQSTIQDDRAKFTDTNGDGFNDFYWKESSSWNTHYKVWLPDEQKFSRTMVLPEAVSGRDVETVLVDLSGDGAPDAVQFNKGSSRHKIYVRGGDAFSSQVIGRVSSGLGLETAIDYKTLADLNDADHYRSYEGVTYTTETQEICTGGYAIPVAGGGYVEQTCSMQDVTSIDSEEFYSNVHNPFSYLPDDADTLVSRHVAPVMEYKGAVPVVAEVNSSAPTRENPQNMQGIQYRYGLNLMQSGGRGSLGFRTLTTIDKQSGIETTTTYRQDWPFIGQPINTVVRTAEGNKLSESVTESRIYQFDDSMSSTAESYGTVALGALQIYTAKSYERTYDLVDNGAVQGEWMKATTVSNEVDEYGNTLSTTVTNEDSEGAKFTTTTNNGYGSTTWEKEKGRLAWSKVTYRRETREGITLTPRTRRTEFSYYTSGIHKGLLFEEYSNKPSAEAAAESVTKHYYDDFGNTIFTTVSGNDGVNRISGVVEYNARGQYVVNEYDVFSSYANQNTEEGSVPSLYNQKRNELGLTDKTSVHIVRAVESVDNYLNPTVVRVYTSESYSHLEQSAYSPFGNLYFSASDSGSYSVKLAEKGAGFHCPYELTAYHTTEKVAGGGEAVECFDVLGRSVRKASRLLDGSWSYTDKQYDELGQVVASSEPSFGDPVDWNRFEFDLRGRTTKITAADGSISTTSYDQFLTTTQNDHFAEKKEVRNVDGQLISSKDDEGNEITYQYRADGELTSMKDPHGNMTQFFLDTMGRKLLMSDPDKGIWQYRYNSLGDLVCQRSSKGVVEKAYDAKGRTVSRTDRKPGGSCFQEPTGEIVGLSTWMYDITPNGLGQLVWERDEISGFKRHLNYDSFGRQSRTITSIPESDGSLSSHYENTLYDQFSRVWKVYDAAREGSGLGSNGVRNVYNEYGHLEKVVSDSAQGYAYYEALNMDARGNVTESALGSGVILQSRYYNEQTGRLENIMAYDPMGRAIQDTTLQWDTLGNLDYRHDQGMGKSGQPRDLYEDYGYDALNRLDDYTLSVSGNQTTIDVNYNSIGNITYKSDVGMYDYNEGMNAQRPHAVKKAGTISYRYDGNGNMINDDRGRTFTYSVFDKVTEITKGNRVTKFHYGPSRSRYKRVDFDQSTQQTTTTRYIGGVEKITHADGSREWRRSVAGGVALVTYNFAPGSASYQLDMQYVLKDHLGSINLITDMHGTVTEEMAFDPWGKRRKVDTWEPLPLASTQTQWYVTTKPPTTRGFTGHEMVDEMEIIHMNGRIYDPLLGRFLQADPMVQSPSEIASLNRYSYVWNNPLNATDPTGFFLDDLWEEVRPFVGIIVATVLSVYAPANAGFWYATFVGGASGAAGAAAMGGTGKDILKGALTGAVSAAMFHGVGDIFEGASSGEFFGTTLSGADFAQKVFAHGMVGGVMSELQGGKFGHGFVSAGLSQAFAGKINGMKTQGARVFASAIVGGTASAATGGKFANGAKTAAFGRLFNEELHEMKARAAQKGFLDRDAITKAHAELRTKVHGTASADPDAPIYLSKADQETLLAYERMQTLDVDISETSYVDNFTGADTFIHEDGLAARNFLLEGYGRVKGGEFNYISVGMMAAHYNHSLAMVPAQAVAWNGLQMLFGQGRHNYGQMFSGSFWGGYGHEYYNQHR